MSVLSRNDIQTRIFSQPPLITEYQHLEDQLQPNGFDLTVQKVEHIVSQGVIGLTNDQRVLSKKKTIAFNKTGFVVLPSGTYLLTLNEILHLPLNICALGHPRSSLLRCGVTINTALWDAGYQGRSQVLLVVYNKKGFSLAKNSRVLQLVFVYLFQPSLTGYQGASQYENMPSTNN